RMRYENAPRATAPDFTTNLWYWSWYTTDVGGREKAMGIPPSNKLAPASGMPSGSVEFSTMLANPDVESRNADLEAPIRLQLGAVTAATFAKAIERRTGSKVEVADYLADREVVACFEQTTGTAALNSIC